MYLAFELASCNLTWARGEGRDVSNPQDDGETDQVGRWMRCGARILAFASTTHSTQTTLWRLLNPWSSLPYVL